jgi:hypothetical protein
MAKDTTSGGFPVSGVAFKESFEPLHFAAVVALLFGFVVVVVALVFDCVLVDAPLVVTAFST